MEMRRRCASTGRSWRWRTTAVMSICRNAGRRILSRFERNGSSLTIHCRIQCRKRRLSLQRMRRFCGHTGVNITAAGGFQSHRLPPSGMGGSRRRTCCKRCREFCRKALTFHPICVSCSCLRPIMRRRSRKRWRRRSGPCRTWNCWCRSILQRSHIGKWGIIRTGTKLFCCLTIQTASTKRCFVSARQRFRRAQAGRSA